MTRQPQRIAAILACYNRKDLTLASLDALFSQELREGVCIEAYLLDDGSTDGTAEAVRQRFPKAHILAGDGSYFWNEGMRTAYAAAMQSEAEYYLWLNDDTRLYQDSLARLLETHAQLLEKGIPEAIIVGSVQDPETNALTYGGMVRTTRWHPFHFKLIQPGPIAQQCDVMHGNCVLIPEAVAQRVGNMDAGYSHALGDIDYALKAGKKGIAIWIAPGFVGTCATNPVEGSWLDTSLTLKQRWHHMQDPKGLPPSDWMLFARKHAGWLWPVYGAMPYVRLLVSTLKSKFYPKKLPSPDF